MQALTMDGVGQTRGGFVGAANRRLDRAMPYVLAACCTVTLGLPKLAEAQASSAKGCGRPDVYIDGARYGLARSVIASDALDLRSIVGGDVAGVEYYTQAAAPVQYRRSGMGCGVLLIWLR